MTTPAPDIALQNGRLYLTRAACERHLAGSGAALWSEAWAALVLQRFFCM